MKTAIAVISPQAEKPSPQGFVITNEIILALVLTAVTTIIGGLLKRSIDMNDKRISDVENEFSKIKSELTKIEISLGRLEGQDLKQDIHRLEQMIASLGRRMDDILSGFKRID